MVRRLLNFRRTEVRSQRQTTLLEDSIFAGGARKVVNVDTALELSAVWRCINLVASTMASLPLNVYRYTANGGREVDRNHELQTLFHYKPNEWQTPFEFWEMMWGHKELRGNAYARIVMDNSGRIRQLIPLHPDSVAPRRAILTEGNEPRIYYEYSPPGGGQRQILLQDEVLHLKGLSMDGLSGLSPITHGATMMGTALAGEEHTSKFFENAVRPSGYIKHPGKFKNGEDLKRFKEAWQSSFGGTANSGKTPVLAEGMEWQKIGFSSVDAELLANRKFSVSEICRWFGVPPHLVFDMERATFNNVEQQSIEFVTHAVAPRCVRIEQIIARDLMSEAGTRTHFVKHKVEGLLRGDIKSRYESYAIARQWGWMSADDINELEDRNPLPDGQGKKYLVPLNMIPADQITPSSNQGKRSQLTFLRNQFGIGHLQLLTETITRSIRKEVLAAKRTINSARSAGAAGPLKSWAAEFYPSQGDLLADSVRSVLQVVVTGLLAAVIFDKGDLPNSTRDSNRIINDTLNFTLEQYLERSRDALFRSLGTASIPDWKAADKWAEDWELNGGIKLSNDALKFVISAVDNAAHEAAGEAALPHSERNHGFNTQDRAA